MSKRQNVMGIEVKELLKPFLFQFKPVVQTSNTSGLEYVTINFVQVSAKTTSNIIRQQTPNAKHQGSGSKYHKSDKSKQGQDCLEQNFLLESL